MARTLHSAFSPFLHQLNSLLHATLTDLPLVPQRRFKGLPVQGFHFGGDDHSAKLKSEGFGNLRLFLGQRCTLIEGELATLEYSYGIGPVDADFTFRWDYSKRLPEGKTHCRHHLQGEHMMELNDHGFQLDDLHMPTGYVPIEDIIRFCINDLAVQPRCEDWDERIAESARRFRTGLQAN